MTPTTRRTGPTRRTRATRSSNRRSQDPGLPLDVGVVAHTHRDRPPLDSTHTEASDERGVEPRHRRRRRRRRRRRASPPQPGRALDHDQWARTIRRADVGHEVATASSHTPHAPSTGAATVSPTETASHHRCAPSAAASSRPGGDGTSLRRSPPARSIDPTGSTTTPGPGSTAITMPAMAATAPSPTMTQETRRTGGGPVVKCSMIRWAFTVRAAR